MQNRIFREGKAMGIEEGREEGRVMGIEEGRIEGFAQGQLVVFTHQIERRLRRPLRPDEQERLAEHLRSEGPDHVADAIVDLSNLELWRALLAPKPQAQ
ncbi:hypothetical protein [Polyangium spumosum]|uniref:DUF4351 domain-containing protein n=1 Tax=Polyangium spumosum TaxID=889282 RepID=A0A6N7Q0S2_9BACT|nr:hypothetical protein [Polyangium spumosum]MRG95884.1 hypothetical protein [Polyangium spumosum]